MLFEMSKFINFIALWSMDNDNMRNYISLHVRISNNKFCMIQLLKFYKKCHAIEMQGRNIKILRTFLVGLTNDVIIYSP